MGLQRIGQTKWRQARAQTGLDLEALSRAGNRLWLGRIPQGDGHAHVQIDPITWEWAPDPGGCWSSCETPRRLLVHASGGYSPEERRTDYEVILATIRALSDAWVRSEVPSLEAGITLAPKAGLALARLAVAANVPPIPHRISNRV